MLFGLTTVSALIRRANLGIRVVTHHYRDMNLLVELKEQYGL